MKVVDKNIAEETATLLLSVKAITMKPNEPYRYTSGMLSPIYCDNRIIISFPKVRKKIINFYTEVIDRCIGVDEVDIISGTATAAVPHAAFIADELKKPMVYITVGKKETDEPKVGGDLRRGKRVVVIEDHISTGGSAVGNALAVRRHGGIANECVITTTYNMKKARDLFNKHRVKVYCLTDINTILDVAVAEGHLDKKDRGTVLEWTKDPATWGKKHGFE